jgi:8-oxo-dGTP pyrophosphatase MutT (NUDIX family)
MSQTELIPIVDLNDEIIGYKARSEIAHDDIYRISWCRIRDQKGAILLAQRARTKKRNPGKRWPAAAGTVEQWETYLENIIKEIWEEIGIEVQASDLIVWTKKYNDYKDKRSFCQRYIYISTTALEIRSSHKHLK